MHMTLWDYIRGFFIAMLGLAVLAFKYVEDRLRGRM
jgi:hypothetical protein